MKLLFVVSITFLMLATGCQNQGTPPPVDDDTKAWWKTTTVLSNDEMEGRDTGSPGYSRAATEVAKQFAAAGLEPLGDDGTWFQTVQMEETAVRYAAITVDGRPLRFLRDVIVPADGAPDSVEASIVYCGYCAADRLVDVKDKLVICHGTRREGLPSDADRMQALTQAGAAGVIMIADPGFTVEPPRWPYAYVRSVALAGTPNPPERDLLYFRLNADALGIVIEGSGQNPKELIDLGSAGMPLPSFTVAGHLQARFTTAHRNLSSPNVIGRLPGTDPTLADQSIVLTAHLDGYGYGAPVNGDSLYNGTLDDAAYVALLIRLAERRAGKGFKRPLIFVALTGEEKGLLGSRYLVGHLPVPKETIAADINLDQLRPLFPLDLLTVHALDETTLGDDATAVASVLQIAVQNDPEPERRLLMRSDHWTFLQHGIPAINFVFGFQPGSESERIYRQWYREGYHTPQDDLSQKIDWTAAAKFNQFFYDLVDRVANSTARPAWKPDSKLRPTE